MHLQLLGPFEMVVDSGPVRLAGRGERALVTVLGLSPGRVVADTTLIEQLWSDGDQPVDPVNALQTRVSKVRRALTAAGGGQLLSRRGAGYILDVDPACVDVHRFTALIDRARRAGAADEAIRLYDAALAEWRAEPFVDFAGELWAAVETTRLVELRLAAIAERAERMLTLGRYEEVVADLEPVVAGAPTRERLVGQLMTGLFNAGRQADALEVYARTQQVLADELGLDPSRELRGLMEQILRQDTAITPVAASPSTARRAEPKVPASGNLPLRLTSFVGRNDDLDRVLMALRGARLVTLAGPGGAGKTSLGVEAARRAGPGFADGVWLVRLAPVTEPEMLIHAFADGLGLSIEGGTVAHRPRDVLVSRLTGRDALIVLDNCEHLIEPVAALVQTILERCPKVRILATSREALAVPGEVQLAVAPLPVPSEQSPSERVPEFPAARLFLDRAAAVRPDLTLDGPALDAVAVICRRLDGIPLALELAAARLAGLQPLELADRVRDRFAVLTSGDRTAEARQRTLRSAVDWSHDLLTQQERVLFRRLAVFRGGWTLTAAETVVADTELPVERVMELLERLVRQSLVVADRSGGHTRYRMLETLRQYATGKLGDAGETAAMDAAHAAFFLAVGERAETGLRGSSQAQWLTQLRTEHANLRAAMSWLVVTDGQVDQAQRLAGSLGLYWHLGRHLEGREMLRRVMALPGGSSHSRARALQAVSLVERPRGCIVHPSAQCAAAARESLTVFRQDGDRGRAAFSELLLAVEGVSGGAHADADTALQRADNEFAELGDDWGRAVAAFVRMETLTYHADLASVRAAAADATTRFRALKDGWGLSAVLYHFGWALTRFGVPGDAVPVLQEAIDVANEAGVYNTAQWATADLGLALLALGRVDEAAAYFTRAGTARDEVGDDAGSILHTYGQAVLSATRGDHPAARALFVRAHDGFRRLGVAAPTGLALAGIAAADEHLGDTGAAQDGYQRLLEHAETSGEMGLTAAALEGLARAALTNREPARAAELLARAAAVRDTYDRPATPIDAEAITATAAAVDRALTETADHSGETGRRVTR
jgi:predicted ATPase/DNA-binding SARP family transcriptional activator